MKISAHNLGLALLILCLMQMASQSALVKAIGDTFSSAQIVFIRGAVGLLLIIPFVWRYRFAALQFSNLRLHLLRALFGVLAMACQFFAFARLPRPHNPPKSCPRAHPDTSSADPLPA